MDHLKETAYQPFQVNISTNWCLNLRIHLSHLPIKLLKQVYVTNSTKQDIVWSLQTASPIKTTNK